MPIVVNRWSPDTCSCELEYSWNTEQEQDKRVHNFERIVKACPAHDTVVSASTTAKTQLKKVYDVVLEENQRKNQALAKALEIRPELAEIVDSTTGQRHDLMTVAKQLKMEDNPHKAAELLNAGTTLKQGINYTWKWVESKAKLGSPRTLEIDFDTPAPTIEEAIAIKSANPNATQEQIKQQAKSRIMGQPDKLQEALDSEFTKAKGRGAVKIKGI